jgi:hypothetical protein
MFIIIITTHYYMVMSQFDVLLPYINQVVSYLTSLVVVLLKVNRCRSVLKVATN